jgi:hypothetical protein
VSVQVGRRSVSRDDRLFAPVEAIDQLGFRDVGNRTTRIDVVESGEPGSAGYAGRYRIFAIKPGGAAFGLQEQARQPVEGIFDVLVANFGFSAVSLEIAAVARRPFGLIGLPVKAAERRFRRVAIRPPRFQDRLAHCHCRASRVHLIFELARDVVVRFIDKADKPMDFIGRLFAKAAKALECLDALGLLFWPVPAITTAAAPL